MRADEARTATGAGKRAKVTKAEQERAEHKKEMAKAIREGKAYAKEDMADVYQEIKEACDDGEEKISHSASYYKRRDDRYWDGGPDAARAEACAKAIVAQLTKDGYKATIRTHYDDTWDPDCGDMSGHTVYVDISWGKADDQVHS